MKYENVLSEVLKHYEMVREDNNTRQTRENGWNDVVDAYWGKLPDDWPFDSKVTIPLIRTSLTEKNARLINSKLRGRLTPRKDASVIGSKINNAILDFQWDTANYGGSMISKWKEMDMDARMMGSCFALVIWRHTEETRPDSKGRKKRVVTFDGNEFLPLNPLDCGIDPNAKNVKDARWFQVRRWQTIADLESENDTATGEVIYPGLAELKRVMSMDPASGRMAQDRRDNEYIERIKSLKGLQDRMGEDQVFPVVEVITEYRKDRWITFSPKHKIILRDIPNPYTHGEIPVVQLNYYKIQDDPWGESEVEPVLPIWRAIQAVVCAYLDTMIIHMRPPLVAVEGQVRQETIKYGPEEVWIVNNQGAITEFKGNTDSLAYFQTTFAALISQFNLAMGDLSQGVNTFDPFSKQEKTATEVRATVRQQNVRDQANQNELAEALKDMMMMWLSNNRQFLFADPTKKFQVIRIVGADAYQAFKQAGFDAMETPNDALKTISDIIQSQGGDVSDAQLQELMQAGEVPRFPVVLNPNERNPEEFQLQPKMEIDENGTEANLYITPEDLDGYYEYIPDVKSMTATFSEEQSLAQQQALQILTGNPVVLELLRAEGFRPNIKELLVRNIESAGDSDAQRYFTRIESQPEQGAIPGGGPGAEPGVGQNLQQPGLPEAPPAVPEGSNLEQMAGSPELPIPGGVLPSVPSVPGEGLSI